MREASKEVIEIFLSISPDTEVASIDEAYMDVSGVRRLMGEPIKIATGIQERVLRELGLSCSIGIAPNKLLAKLGSDMKKPGGITVIRQEDVARTMEDLPVGKLCGIGRKVERTLKLLNIKTAGELGRFPVDILRAKFGVVGLKLHYMALGVDDSPVIPHIDAPDAKSIGNSTTLEEDVSAREDVNRYILKMSTSVGRRVRLQHKAAKTITLSLKYSDFSTFTRSVTLDTGTDCDKTIYEACRRIFESIIPELPVRSVGVRLTNLEETQQMSLFSDPRRGKLNAALDTLLEKHGPVVRYASLAEEKKK